MKEYKYKINGNEYNVAVDNIEGNIAHIQVNGVAYDVELPEQPKAAPAVKRVAGCQPQIVFSVFLWEFDSFSK